MQLVPANRRRTVLEELTAETLTDWYQARDLAVPEFSFVLHDRETTDAAAPGRQMLHSHSFCAGSVPTLEGRECPLVRERDVVRNKGGLERATNLNRIVEQHWAALLDREIGLNWRLDRELAPHVQVPSLRFNEDSVTRFEGIVSQQPTSSGQELPEADVDSPSYEMGF